MGAACPGEHGAPGGEPAIVREKGRGEWGALWQSLHRGRKLEIFEARVFLGIKLEEWGTARGRLWKPERLGSYKGQRKLCEVKGCKECYGELDGGKGGPQEPGERREALWESNWGRGWGGRGATFLYGRDGCPVTLPLMVTHDNVPPVMIYILTNSRLFLIIFTKWT